MFDHIEASEKQQPGPGDYGNKRMFDNKQAIDYSKRFQSSATNSGYNTIIAFSNQDNNAITAQKSSKSNLDYADKER